MNDSSRRNPAGLPTEFGGDLRFRAAGTAVHQAGHRFTPPSAAALHQRRRQTLTVRSALALAVLVPLVAVLVGTANRHDPIVALGSADPNNPSASNAPGTATTSSNSEGVPPNGEGPEAGNTITWDTPFVRLHSERLRIENGGPTFLAAADHIAVTSDPGRPDEYTTLEATWHEHGTEMRVNLYFRSDGTEWWSDEQRTYRGDGRSEWITYTGEQFRSPLGVAFTGDVTLRSGTNSFTLRGLSLEAFRRPAVCAAETSDPPPPVRIELLYPSIVMAAETGSGYGASIRLRDAQCSVIHDVAPFLVTFSVPADSPIAIQPKAPKCSGPMPDPIDCDPLSLELRTLRQGTVVVAVEVRSNADGGLLASAPMAVTAGASSGTSVPSP